MINLSLYYGIIILATLTNIPAVLEEDFVTRYFLSLGDLTFLNNSSELIDEFGSTLRDNLEFDPEDDDDDDDDEEDTTDVDGEEDTDVDGFNVARFLRKMVTRFEDFAIEQFAQNSVNSERGQCIRRVIEVSTSH